MRIAVYGASGYQGKLVLAEAVRRGLGVVLATATPYACGAPPPRPDCATRTSGRPAWTTTTP